ncbi:arginine--tRNA ligase [Inquilinus sp. Marseille-Q2685]|uniref:arginine--tRNA ligase n=1 Tax=Inquilinus sp. Marseille-Q2685 TaxID=2866581 RepID=UPI001CE47AA3|nr:arginine--tRNA ligase [Inquilinus sp. Marseille-Q2685]
MSSLASKLTETVAAAFAAEGLPPELGHVTVSNRPDLGQFQCNGALAAAKQALANPREIAQRVADRLAADPQFASVSLAGPGFINLSLTDAVLADHVDAQARDERLGVPKTNPPRRVVLDYGGPNIAKPMHVGHLRASIIGDSLRRLFRFAGDETIGDVHMGDWGTPMGMVISEIARRQPDLPYFDPDFTGPYPAESPVTMEDLEVLYPAASQASKADPARMEESRKATAELQAGRPGYRALWQHFIDVSIAGMQREFDSLGVHFDLWKGEAAVHDLIEPMVEDLKARGLAETDEGAVIVRVAEEGDRKEVPPLILVKSDGAFTYGTTDLATIVDRRQSLDPDLGLYVVDRRQSLHFEQVFRAARKAGLNGKSDLEHLGYGTMNGPDGKPFKTRAGGVMKLYDLLDTATEIGLKRLEEAHLAEGYPEEERREIARRVGIAAVKFADLSNNPSSDYVFDLDRMLRFEGKTGPYLQYAAVRAKSLLRRAEGQGDAPGTILPAANEADRALMLQLGQLPDAVRNAYEKRAPNELCDFAYALAREFSRFYDACHVLSEPDPARRASWLGLAALTLRQLERVLDLLGIEIPDRM